MKPFLLCVLVASGSVLAAGKGAQSTSAAVEQANKQMAEGDLDQAMRTLDLALTKASGAKAIVSIQLLRGQCLAGLQKADKALQAFAAALEKDPTAELDASSANPEAVELLEKARAKYPGELAITVKNGAGTVKVDGTAMGPAPLRTKVAPGKHQVEVTGGSRTATRAVEVKAARVAAVELELPVEPATPAVATKSETSDVPARAGEPAPPSVSAARQAPPEVAAEAPRRGGSKLGWLPLGAGVVAAGVGTYFLISASSAHGALTSTTGSALTPSEADALVAKGKLGQPLGIALVAIGGAAVAGGITMLLLSGHGDGDAEAALVPVPGGAAVSFAGRW